MYDLVSQPTDTEDSRLGENVSVPRSDDSSAHEKRALVSKNARRDEVPASIRWVRRILAILILICLAMAAWVWADILHGFQ